MVKFENGSVGTFEATRFGIGIKNGKTFQIHGSGGMLRFNLERLNHLELVDASEPSVEQGPRDLLVTDLKHPIFGNYWPPGHIIGYEHTFTHTVFDLLEAIADDRMPEPNFVDGVRNQQVLAAIEEAAEAKQWVRVERGTSRGRDERRRK